MSSLTEENKLAQGTEKLANDAANYAGDVYHGKKSLGDIGSDLWTAGGDFAEGVKDDYLAPIGTHLVHRVEDIVGGPNAKLKRTLQESYERGETSGRVLTITGEAAATVFTGGTAGVVIKTMSTATRLKPDLPKGDRTPDGNGSDGSNGSDGNGTPLFGLFDPFKKDMETLDGKLKTKAKTVEDALKEMQDMINSLLAGMKEGKRPFLRQEAHTGMWFISWERVDGGGGDSNNNDDNNNNRDAEGTGKAGFKLTKPSNSPNPNAVPKGNPAKIRPQDDLETVRGRTRENEGSKNFS